MYLLPTRSYYRGTEQCAGRAPFLILFSWNDYKALDEIRASCAQCIELARVRNAGIDRWNDDPVNNAADRGAFDLPAVCPAHTGIKSNTPVDVYRYPNGKPKLWAIVRKVALRQCGHFMMGSARIGGASITISGSCGADGLPRDYQEVPPAYRDRLILVPEDIAAIYWSDDGHNTIGKSAPSVRSWALATFGGA